jgi:hypothetical protein
MPQSDSSQIESLDEELVAYLDGQLDPETARHVEQRLANEENARRRLQQLAQSWDMLDQLPHAVADETFTRSTVQMVAVAAEQELTDQQAVEPRRRRRRWLFAAALALLAGSCGFLAAAKLWTDPNEQLLRDLSTIENVEAYHQVGDIDFLHKLNDEGLFSDDAPDATAGKTTLGAPDAEESRAGKEPPPSSSLDTLDQRRVYLAKISPQEKDELRSKFEMFEALSSEERDRLRKLDELLNKDSHEDRLRRLMARYSDWFKTLLTYERGELLLKTPTGRIQQIRNLRHAQEARLAAFAGASKPDVAAIHIWMEKFAKNHEEELLKDARPRMQKELSTATGLHRAQLLTFLAWQHWRPAEFGKTGDVSKTPAISDKEVQDLIETLSETTRQKLMAEPDERLETIKLLQTVAQANSFNRRGGARSNVTVEDLHKTFEQLSVQERDRLLGLPRDEMDRELRAKYFRQKFGGREPGQRDGPPPGENPAGRENRGPRERQRGGPRPDAGAKRPNSPAEKEADPPMKPNDAASSPATPGSAAAK